MAIIITEIQALIDHIESSTNKKYQTPNDFENLSSAIFNATKNNISVSTLKRLWGYIKQRENVRKSTLDVLASYLGYRDFCHYQKEQYQDNNSGYFNEQIILSAGLKPGTILEIGWKPNRLCRMKYQGDNYFEFISTINTSLKANTLFRTAVFTIGQPLYLEDINNEATRGKIYIAGKNTGLNILRVVNEQ